MHIKGILAIPALLFSAALASCGGGGNGSSLPATTHPAPITSPSTSDKMLGTLALSPSGTAAASQATNFKYHMMKVQNAAPQPVANYRRPQGVAYPADLSYGGGAVIAYANFYNIFINCSASCWGSSVVPGQFLADFFNSSYIHIMDMYAETSANNRYQIVGHFQATANLYSTAPGTNPVLSQGQIVGLVHDAIAANGNQAGYGNVYNVFLPTNMDTCFDFSGGCYSPDVPGSFAFCGYHSSVDFPDLGVHAIYTVEPYDNVQGCQVNTAQLTPPNGVANDSQDSVLLHETFETLSDPDPGNGWYNWTLGENGDICQPWESIFNFNGANFETQLIYSNYDHACTNAYP